MTIILAVVITVLNVLDGLTTYQVLKLGGSEANPAVKWLMEKIGVYSALLVSKCCAIALAWIIAFVPIAHPDGEVIQLVLLGALALLYVWIAVNNWQVYQRRKANEAQGG